MRTDPGRSRGMRTNRSVHWGFKQSTNRTNRQNYDLQLDCAQFIGRQLYGDQIKNQYLILNNRYLGNHRIFTGGYRHRVWVTNRQNHPKGRSLAQLALTKNLTTQYIDQAFNNRQPNPNAGFIGCRASR